MRQAKCYMCDQIVDMTHHVCQGIQFAVIPKQEQCCVIPVSLLMDVYAEMYKSHPDLSEKLKKCITGEK